MGRIAHQNASKSSLKASSPSAASPSQIMAPSVLPTAYVEPMCSSELITSVQKVFNKNASTSAQKLSEGISSLQSSQLRFYHLPTMICIAIAVFLTSLSCSTTLANPVFVDNPQLAQFQSGRNIRHLPCIVRKSGRSGVCMFAIDCIKQNGTHLGTCIDRFYFGSCCQIKEETPAFEPEINDNSIDQNTISHFVHESTTLPTSALFKLTTELPNHIKPSSSSVGDFVKNVTQGYTAPATSTSTSSKPTKTTTSKRPRPPPAYTTHRNSQFVVRTTGKPTVAPTTIKPPRRKTTTARPVLTTDKIEVEQRIETTAVPTKFYTFQMVETTTPSATEPAKASDFVTTTPRPVDTTERTKLPDVRPIITSTSSSMTTSTITISTIPTTAPTTSILRTTHRPRPVTTKKPAHTKRPTSKPSRKPSVPLFNESTQGDSTQQTTAYKPSRRPAPTNSPLPTAYNEVNATFAQTQAQTTRAPRPKPKPTAEIVKVPKPVPGNEATTSAPSPTKKPTKPSTAQPSNVTTTQVPTKPTKFSSSTTTKRKPGTTPTSSTTSTTTSTASPTTTSSTTSATTTASSTTTEQYYTLTTDAPKVDIRPISTSTEITQKPGLITWTNVDGEPNVNISNSAEWIPQPDEPAWVPVSTIDLESSSNRPEIHTPSEALTTEASFNSSTDKFIVSIATSISEIMSNSSMQSSRPDHTVTSRPVKPTKNSTSTTNPPTSTSLPTSSTTENPLEEEFSTEVAGITDNILSTATGTGSNTIEYSTEDDNVKDSLSTAAPPNALEGMDFREICGRRMFPEPRIVGGSNAAFGRWPWQISLRQWRTSTYLHKCGAALLNENWAITAAHCVDNVPPSDLLLRLGEYDLAEEEEPYGYQERRVQIVASHPQFDPRTFEYDLALLRFYEPVIFQPNIIPVCVPNSDLDFIGQTAFVTGWGRLYEDGPLPSVLQEVAVPVINNTICESMYRAAGYIEHIPHIFICAGWKKGGYDSCEGDSGGPMVLQREEDKRFQLGGVISWGIGCAEANQPGVYTRISEFRDWINQILQFYFYEPVIFQPNIIPVCVPNSDLDFIGQTAFVTGWGRLYEDGPLPSVLQEVAVPVINNTICESMYRAAGYIEHIPHIFICAGWKKGGYDSCEGDSGGPMVLQREEDKRFQLGGVISWGIGCAEANQPGVYTRISEFRDWINQILQF